MDRIRIITICYAFFALAIITAYYFIFSKNIDEIETTIERETKSSKASTMSLTNSGKIQDQPGIPINRDDNDRVSQADSFPYNIRKMWESAIHASNHPEDLLFSAMTSAEMVMQNNLFTTNANRELHEWYLIQAYSIDPENLLINDQILDYCLETSNASICSVPYLETLLQLDGMNAISYLKGATVLHQRGDISGALALMEQSSTAPEYDDYYLKYLKAVDQSYQRSGIERGIGVVTSYFTLPLSKSMMSYGNMCSQKSTSVKEEWNQSCLTVSNRIAENSKTQIWQRLGKSLSRLNSDLDSIERKFYQQSDDAEYDELLYGFSPQDQIIQNKLMSSGVDIPISDEIWESYLKLYSEGGELAAITYLLNQLLSK